MLDAGICDGTGICDDAGIYDGVTLDKSVSDKPSRDKPRGIGTSDGDVPRRGMVCGFSVRMGACLAGSVACAKVRALLSAFRSWQERVGVLMLVAVVAVVCGVVLSPQRADSDSGPQEVVSYVVAPGDTLWSYAEAITPPGGDVNDAVDELREMNHLRTTKLQTGQRIVVPKHPVRNQ